MSGEDRPLSEGARRELLRQRFSYYTDDLVVLTWDRAFIHEPRGDSDVMDVANARLLEMRYYDQLLQAELPWLEIWGGASLFRRVHTYHFPVIPKPLQRPFQPLRRFLMHDPQQPCLQDGVFLQRFGASLERYLPVHQHVGPIDQRQNRFGVLLDNHHRDLTAQAGQRVHPLFHDRGCQTLERFVQQDQFRRYNPATS